MNNLGRTLNSIPLIVVGNKINKATFYKDISYPSSRRI